MRLFLFHPVTSIANTLRRGWIIVHGVVASTPVARQQRLVGRAYDGGDLLVAQTRFEFTPSGYCATRQALGLVPENARILMINHWNEFTRVSRDGQSTERQRIDLLDGRPLRAVSAVGRERIVVLAPDPESAGEWILIASLNIENGALSEGALDNVVGARSSDVMTQCRATARGLEVAR